MELTASHYALLFAAGLSGGFIDAIAGGGGLITVPTLLGVGLPPQLALGTNKAQSSCGTIIAVRRYARAGLVGWAEVRLAAALACLGSMAGAWTLTLIGNDALRRVIPWMLLAVVTYVALTPRLGAQAAKARIDATLFGWTFGLSLGFYDGFFGPGTGAFWILGLVTLLGQELTRANAFTKVVNLASNLGSLLIFALHGQVAPWVALAMIAGQLIGARLGAGLVLKHGAGLIRGVFLVVVLALVLRLLWSA
ncbi:MAG: TSUP family transporter [Opitutia bacterium]